MNSVFCFVSQIRNKFVCINMLLFERFAKWGKHISSYQNTFGCEGVIIVKVMKVGRVFQVNFQDITGGGIIGDMKVVEFMNVVITEKMEMIVR